MTTITITHTPAEGTLADGMVRGDGSYEILTAGRLFKWGRSIDCLYVPHSRDHAPKLRAIEDAAARLEAAGFDVDMDIDTRPRSAADADAARRGRLGDRADALDAKADRRAAEGAAREAAGNAVFDAIPFGQPMLVGHYSYKSDRNRRERAWENLSKGYALQAEAGRVADRAATAARNAEAPADPRALMRKIKTLQADLGRYERARDGIPGQRDRQYADLHKPATGTYRAELESRIAYAQEAMAYAQQQLDAARAAGAVIYGPDDFDRSAVKAGRVWVRCWAGGPDGYARVTRVNPKSVTVARHPRDDQPSLVWTETMPYDKVFGVRADEPAQDLEPADEPDRPAPRARTTRTAPPAAEGDTRRDRLQWIVDQHQAARVDGRTIDVQTASGLTALYAAARVETHAKLDAMPLDKLLTLLVRALGF